LENEVQGFGTKEGWLAYASMGKTLMAVGGIHGSQAMETLGRWVRAARENGFKRWLLFPVARGEQSSLQQQGFNTLHVGSEALVKVQEFQLDGPERRNLRQTIQRAERAGSLTLNELSHTDNFGEVKEVFQEWLDRRIRSFRMRLLVGAPGFENLQERRIYACECDGSAVAFITVTPGWNESGWGMDIMARSPQAPPGVMEWLISNVIFSLREEGVQWFSLGACPMRLMIPREAGESRLFRFIFERLYGGLLGGRLFRFRDLARFKEKFCPEWIPIYFGASPRISMRALYDGCRMWGLFDEAPLDNKGWAELESKQDSQKASS
jgi:phosphatidylglycerol lysyltransferase